MLLSEGGYDTSRLILFEFDLDKCQFNPIQESKLNEKLFGEGIAVVGDMVYQLTYKSPKILQW